MHFAARCGRTEVCQLLVEAEADVNAADECAFMFKLLFLLLIIMHAPHPPPCRNGTTPMDFAIKANKPDVVELLQHVITTAPNPPQCTQPIPDAFVQALKLSLERGTPLPVSDGPNGPVITLNGLQHSLDDRTPWLSFEGKGAPYSYTAVLECVRTFDMGYMDYQTYTERAKLPKVFLVDRQALLQEILGTSPSQANVDACLSDI